MNRLETFINMHETMPHVREVELSKILENEPDLTDVRSVFGKKVLLVGDCRNLILTVLDDYLWSVMMILWDKGYITKGRELFATYPAGRIMKYGTNVMETQMRSLLETVKSLKADVLRLQRENRTLNEAAVSAEVADAAVETDVLPVALSDVKTGVASNVLPRVPGEPVVNPPALLGLSDSKKVGEGGTIVVPAAIVINPGDSAKSTVPVVARESGPLSVGQPSEGQSVIPPVTVPSVGQSVSTGTMPLVGQSVSTVTIPSIGQSVSTVRIPSIGQSVIPPITMPPVGQSVIPPITVPSVGQSVSTVTMPLVGQSALPLGASASWLSDLRVDKSVTSLSSDTQTEPRFLLATTVTIPVIIEAVIEKPVVKAVQLVVSEATNTDMESKVSNQVEDGAKQVITAIEVKAPKKQLAQQTIHSVDTSEDASADSAVNAVIFSKELEITQLQQHLADDELRIANLLHELVEKEELLRGLSQRVEQMVHGDERDEGVTTRGTNDTVKRTPDTISTMGTIAGTPGTKGTSAVTNGANETSGSNGTIGRTAGTKDAAGRTNQTVSPVEKTMREPLISEGTETEDLPRISPFTEEKVRAVSSLGLPALSKEPPKPSSLKDVPELIPQEPVPQDLRTKDPLNEKPISAAGQGKTMPPIEYPKRTPLPTDSPKAIWDGPAKASAAPPINLLIPKTTKSLSVVQNLDFANRPVDRVTSAVGSDSDVALTHPLAPSASVLHAFLREDSRPDAETQKDIPREEDLTLKKPQSSLYPEPQADEGGMEEPTTVFAPNSLEQHIEIMPTVNNISNSAVCEEDLLKTKTCLNELERQLTSLQVQLKNSGVKDEHINNAMQHSGLSNLLKTGNVFERLHYDATSRASKMDKIRQMVQGLEKHTVEQKISSGVYGSAYSSNLSQHPVLSLYPNGYLHPNGNDIVRRYLGGGYHANWNGPLFLHSNKIRSASSSPPRRIDTPYHRLPALLLGNPLTQMLNQKRA